MEDMQDNMEDIKDNINASVQNNLRFLYAISEDVQCNLCIQYTYFSKIRLTLQPEALLYLSEE